MRILEYDLVHSMHHFLLLKIYTNKTLHLRCILMYYQTERYNNFKANNSVIAGKNHRGRRDPGVDAKIL